MILLGNQKPSNPKAKQSKSQAIQSRSNPKAKQSNPEAIHYIVTIFLGHISNSVRLL